MNLVDGSIEKDGVQKIYLDLAWDSIIDEDLYHAEMDNNCASASITEIPPITTLAPAQDFIRGFQEILKLQKWTHAVVIVDEIFGNRRYI